VNRAAFLWATVSAVLISHAAWAQAPPAAAAGEPATTRPAPPSPGIAATVGKVHIATDRVDKCVAHAAKQVPLHKLPELRNRILANMLLMELTHQYLVANRAGYDPNDLAELKATLAAQAKQARMTEQQLLEANGLTEEQLVDQVRLRKLERTTTDKQRLAAFMKANPRCFNGSKVRASHILLPCGVVAPTAEQKAVLARLEKLRADIKGGRITFEAAAKAYSSCSTGKMGGDLGEFTFDRMVPPFSQAAFDTDVGRMTEIVRTQFGFHLIKVTGRVDGKQPPGAGAEKIAAKILFSRFQNRVLDLALTACPIIIYKQR